LDAAQASYCCGLLLPLERWTGQPFTIVEIRKTLLPTVAEFSHGTQPGVSVANRVVDAKMREVTKTPEIDPLHTITKPFNERRTKTRTGRWGVGVAVAVPPWSTGTSSMPSRRTANRVISSSLATGRRWPAHADHHLLLRRLRRRDDHTHR
jgi:hypothetical protein